MTTGLEVVYTDGGDEAFDLRGRLIQYCLIIGFGVPTLCFVAVLLGATRETFPHDQVAVLGVLFSIYAPILAFVNNKGERRTLERQLVEFAFLVFFTNVGYQFFWEMPWFILKESIYATGVTEADKWFWPWWAYGVADTRYLKPNELSISISGMDASVAMLEVFIVIMYFRGYRILAAWFALLMGTAMGWGQYYFYMGEIYFEFRNVEDGWFGFWIKYMVMNIPWLIFPFVAGAGFIWHLVGHYKRVAVREFKADELQYSETNFYDASHMFDRSTEDYEPIGSPRDLAFIKKWIIFAFLSPLVFLAVDMWRFYT
jgi:hypothetical protein